MKRVYYRLKNIIRSLKALYDGFISKQITAMNMHTYPYSHTFPSLKIGCKKWTDALRLKQNWQAKYFCHLGITRQRNIINLLIHGIIPNKPINKNLQLCIIDDPIDVSDSINVFINT